jgi:sugar O-acyltransferase (sialic acid O-acetyltransferase NeuD family)
MYLAGTGGFAAEILEYIAAAGGAVAGLIELIDPARIGSVRHGLNVIAPDASVNTSRQAVIGVNGNRLGLWSVLAAHRWTPAAAVIHPRAMLSLSAKIGDGSIVGPLAVVGAESVLGEHTLVGRGSLIGHHVVIEAGATIYSGANIGGTSRIGCGAQIGMGAIVLNTIHIGAGAIVAAGAVVTRHVPDGIRVQGVPAQVYGVGKALS